MGVRMEEPKGEPKSEPLSKPIGCPCMLRARGVTCPELGRDPKTEPGPSEPLSKVNGCPCSRQES